MITLRPKHPEARRLLALAHCTLGEIDKAISIFEEWLRGEPGRSRSRGTCWRLLRPRRPDARVGRLRRADFRQFRRELRVEAGEAVVSRAGAGRRDARGCRPRAVARASTCSTRAAAPVCAVRSIAPYARRLTASISRRACWRRRRRSSVYDELVQSELTEYLREPADAFDVIVSADTLVYFGALEDVVAAAAGALRSGGLLDLHARARGGRVGARLSASRRTAAIPRARYVERCSATWLAPRSAG